MVEDLATSGKQFHVWAIMNKEELYMARLLNGGYTTVKPLRRKLYLANRGVKTDLRYHLGFAQACL